jgi:dCMP deaminase
MIIGLFGSETPLKSRLRDFLSSKGFYSCEPSELSKLESDRNYVLVCDEVPEDFGSSRQRSSARVWIGKETGPGSSLDLVLDGSEPEEQIQESIQQLILRGVRAQERPDWDEYFIRIAQVASTRSNCIKRKVGAVVVRDRRIISTGYNGTPRGTRNCNEGGCPRCNSLASSGTRLDECLCSHAEENAITQAAYHGTSVKGATIYTTFAPCLMCSKMVINSGIQEVVYNVDYPLNEVVFRLFEQAEVKIRQHRLI